MGKRQTAADPPALPPSPRLLRTRKLRPPTRMSAPLDSSGRYVEGARHSCRPGLPPYRRRDVRVAQGCPLTGGATFLSRRTPLAGGADIPVARGCPLTGGATLLSRGAAPLQEARHCCRAGLPPYRRRDIRVAQGCPLTGGATLLSPRAAPLQGARHCCRAGLPPCMRRDIPVAQGCPLTGGATFLSRRTPLAGGATFVSRRAAPLHEAGHSCLPSRPERAKKLRRPRVLP